MTQHAIYIAGWLTLSPVAVVALWSLARDLRIAFRVCAPMLRPAATVVRVLFPGHFRRSVQNDDLGGIVVTMLRARFRSIALKVRSHVLDGFLPRHSPAGVVRNVRIWNEDVAILAAPVGEEPDLVVGCVDGAHAKTSGFTVKRSGNLSASGCVSADAVIMNRFPAFPTPSAEPSPRAVGASARPTAGVGL